MITDIGIQSCEMYIAALEKYDEPVMKRVLSRATKAPMFFRYIETELTYYEPRLYECDDGRVGLLGVHDD